MMLEETGVELLSPHSENFGHNIYVWKKKKRKQKVEGKYTDDIICNINKSNIHFRNQHLFRVS